MAGCSISILLPGYSLNTDVGSIGFCSVLLIEGDKRVLFDPGHVGRRRFLLPALESRGLKPADIDTQFLSHCHWDHVQNIDLFEGATTLVHRDERRYTRHPHPNDWATPKWTGPVLDMYNPMEVGDGYEVMPGCHVVELPGHSAGSMGLLVETAEGRCVVAGDAVANGGAALSGNIPIIFWNEEKARASVKRVVDLDAAIYPGHDRPFRVRNGEVQYLVDFKIALTGLTPETRGATFDTTPRPAFVMPAIEEQTLERLAGV